MKGIVLSLVRGKAKEALLGVPGQEEYVLNADDIVRCGQQLARTIPQRTTTTLEVFLDNITTPENFCELLDYVVEEWTEGCEDFFDMIMADAPYIACRVALECRKNVARPDFVHGVCLKRCKNEGNRTTCEEPALVRAGLNHENVCNDCVPAVAWLNYLTFPELCTTILSGLFMSAFDKLFAYKFSPPSVNFENRQTVDLPSPPLILNVYLSSSCSATS